MAMLTDCTRFGLFLMLFNTAYKFTLCFMRRLGCLDDRINAPIAGFFSALSIAFDAQHRRELILTLMMSRAIDSSIKKLETSEIVPKLKQENRDFILWLLANCFIGTCMGLRQSVLNN